MSRKMNRILSMILMITMLTGMIPESLVYAHDEEPVSMAEDAEITGEVSEDSVSEDGAPQEDDQGPGQTASSNEAEDAVSDDTVSGDAVSEDTVLENGVSENTASDNAAEAESYPEFIPDPVVIDGMRISVYAAAGAFPEGVTLSVSKVSRKELRKVEKTLEGERGENEKAALSYTYDIKILDSEGQEIQPADGKEVKVSFATDAVANVNLDTNVYHISEDDSGKLMAESLPVSIETSDENNEEIVATVETDGFSYYTVEFTYDEKQYVMQGDSSVALVDILSYVGITKADGSVAESSDISAVSVSNEELFSASNESGEWMVTAHQAFHTEEWMKVTVDGVEYEIVVTDAVTQTFTFILSGVNNITHNIQAGTYSKDTKIVINGTNNNTNPLNMSTVINFYDAKGNRYTPTVTYSNSISGGVAQFEPGQLGWLRFNADNVRNCTFTLDSLPGDVSQWKIQNITTTVYNSGGGPRFDVVAVGEPSANPTLTNITAIYDGNAHMIGTSGGSGGTVYYATSNDNSTWSDWTTTVPSRTAAGATYVKAKVIGDNFHTDSTETTVYTITVNSPATAPTLTGWSGTYNGIAHSVTATGASGGTVYYRTSENNSTWGGWSTTAPSRTNVGTTYVQAYTKGDNSHSDSVVTSSVSITISKRTVTPTAPTLTTGTLTYNGTAKTLANAGSTTAGGTMYYYVSTSQTAPTFSTSTWKTSIDSKTEAGTYYIFWYDYVSDTSNNNDTTADKINSVQSLGSRTIGNATITVTAPDQSYTYTGNPQGVAITATSVNSQAVTIKYRTTDSGDYNLTAAPTATNVADSKTVYYQVSAPNHNTVTGSYTLTITKADASVTAPTANTPTYSGSAQDLVTAGSTADGTLLYKLGTNGTYSTDIPVATNAGTYTVYYKVTGDANHNNTTEAYFDVTVARKPITPSENLGLASSYPSGSFPEVVIHDDDRNVDIPDSEYNVSYSNINHPGEQATVTVTDRTGGNYAVATRTYTYDVENGIPTVTVSPRSVGSIEYNGTAQQLLANGGTALHGTVYYAVTTTATKPDNSAYTITDPTAITGTAVGTYYIWYLVRGAAGYTDLYADETGAYDTATITRRSITITAASANKDYDSTALTSDAYSVTSGSLADGDSITDITISGTQTEVGSSNNTASGAVIKHGTTDVTSCYIISYAIGTLTVNRKAVTIVADNGEWTYDGTSHSIDTFTVTGKSESDAHVFTVTMTSNSKITDAGISANVISSVDGVLMTTGTAKNIGNYTVTTANGTLKVNKAASSITTAPVSMNSLIYNGSDQTLVDDSNASVSGGTLQYRLGTTGDYSDNIPTGKNAGDYTVYYKLAGDSNHNDADGGNFVVTIGQKPVTVSGITASNKIYDGTTSASLLYTGAAFEGIVAGDNLSVSATGTFDTFLAGTGKTVAISAITLGGTSVADYKLAENGNQSSTTADITQKALTITADSDSKVYDGTALTKSTYTSNGLLTGDALQSVTVTGSQTVVGSSSNIPSAAVIKRSGTDVTSCYAITYTNGTLTVTSKAVTITAGSDSKVYDGTALTKDSYTNTTLGTGDSIDSVTITGSQTVVGTSNNVPSAAVIKNAANEDVTASYTITYVNGTLEVTKKAVTITADSDTKVYDGTALTKDSYTNTTLGAGDSIESVTITGSQTAVGASNNVPSAAVIKNAADADVTASYEITYANGTLTVTKQTLTISADSATKVYDGTALTKNSFTAVGLAAGDSIAAADITITGSQTNVGISENVASGATVRNTGSEDVTANYEITYEPGTLTVTKAPVTVSVSGNNNTAVYDGHEHSISGYTVTSISSTLYTATDFSLNGTATAARTAVGTTNMGLVPASFTNNNANFDAEFEVTDGYQTITQKAVTISADNATRAYDGTPLTKNTYTSTGLATGDSIAAVTVTGSLTDVGVSANVPSAAIIKNAGNEDVTASYDITYENGTLTVTQAVNSVTVSLAGWVYGGMANDPVVNAAFGADTAVFTYYTDADCTSKTGSTPELGGAQTEGGKPVHAGTYYVKAEIPEHANYSASSNKAEFTIAKADSSVDTAPAARTLTYDHSAQELVSPGTATGGTMQYVLGTDADTAPSGGYTASIPAGTDAGNNYVWYKVAGDNDHSDSTPLCVTVVIGAALLSEETAKIYDIPDQNYTGEEVTPKPVIKHGGYQLKEDVDYTLSYENNIERWESGDNAPVVTVTGKGNYSGTLTGTFRITQPAFGGTISVTMPEGLVFGDPLGAVPVITAKDKNDQDIDLSGETITFYYGNATGEGSIWDSTKKLDAGDYYVWATVAEKTGEGGHSAVTSERVKITVAKADTPAPDQRILPAQETGYDVTLVLPAGEKNTDYEYIITPGDVNELNDNYKWSTLPVITGGKFRPFTYSEPTGTTVTEKDIENGKTYKIWLRKKADANHNASAAVSMSFTTPEEVQLIYDANGGSGTVPAPKSYAYGATTDVIAATEGLKRYGYSFNGWNTKADGTGTPYAANSAGFVINANTTLYAQWTANSFTVSYNANGGSGNMIDSEFTFGTAKKLDKNTFAREGFGFIGWAISSDGDVVYKDEQSIKDLAESGTVTLFAVWAVNGYSISGKVMEYLDGSTEAGIVAGVKLKLMRGNTQFGNEVITDISGTYTFSNVSAGTYNIIALKDVDGTENDRTMTALVEVNSDQTVDTIYLPAQRVNSVVEVGEGTPAVMVGELDEVAKENAAANEAVTVTLTVQEKNENTAEGAESIRALAEGRSVSGSSLELEYLEINIKKKVGNAAETSVTETDQVIELIVPFSFANKKNCSIWRHHDGEAQSFNRLSAKPVSAAAFRDRTYYEDRANSRMYIYGSRFSTYAISYETSNKVRITFRKNDGTDVQTTQEITLGEATALTANSFSRSSYSFTGWNTEANGSGTAYTDGQIISPVTDLVLYAQWQYIIPPTTYYTVSFDMNGHGTQINPKSVASGGRVIRPADPEEEGFVFGGWFTDKDCTAEYDFGSSVTRSFTLYAKWTKETEPAVSLNAISIITPPLKTEYVEGEKFDPAGMVVSANYTDGSCRNVTGYTWTPDGALTVSDNIITVSYTEKDITRTAQQTVSVSKNGAEPTPPTPPGPEPPTPPDPAEELDLWNLFEEESREYTVSGIAGGAAIANSNTRSAAYFDATLDGDTISVSIKNGISRKKAAKQANAVLSFVLEDGSRLEYLLPVKYQKPVLKLSVKSAALKEGSKAEVQTTVLIKRGGNYEPMELNDAEVKFNGAEVNILEGGKISITAESAASGKVSVRKTGWESAVEKPFTIKAVKKDVLSVDLGGAKIIRLNSNAKSQSFKFPVYLNGEAAADVTIEDKKNSGIAAFADGVLTLAYPETGTKAGNYTIVLRAGDAKCSVKVKVSDKELSKAVTFRIKSRINVVTGEAMVLTPVFKDVNGTISTVSIENEDYEAELDENGNIIVNYTGTALNAKNLVIGTLNFKLGISGIDDEVAVSLTKVKARKTAPGVKAAKVTVAKDAAGDVIAVANIVCTYKGSDGRYHSIVPESATIKKLSKGITAAISEDDNTLVNITKLEKKRSTIKIALTFKGGVTRNVTIRVKKSK